MYITMDERERMAEYIAFMQRDNIVFNYNMGTLEHAYGKITADDIKERVGQKLNIKIG
ncbi:hypothetical protein P4639_22045 [Priestia megaterium]|uniref:hypothetical protein n=1 Tax=Priestia megaterium TaxID=1404 RepID=UPI002E209E6E|nr:hypothetical protein [Priestia megaterium]